MFYVHRLGVPPAPYEAGASVRGRKVDRVSAVRPLHEEAAAGTDTREALESPNIPFRREFEAYARQESMPRKRRRIVLARELMTSPVISLPPDASIDAVEELFAQHRVRHVPIVTLTKEVVGVLSDRDLLRHFSAQAKDARRSDDAAQHVSAIMSSPVLIATADTEIREIARVMFDEHVSCLPITNESGMLEGILTRTDILRSLLISAPLELWG